MLFMASAYILFLNPLILSGNSIGFPTGMPAEDVTLATTFSTGVATMTMGLVGNYPWVSVFRTSRILKKNSKSKGPECGPSTSLHDFHVF